MLNFPKDVFKKPEYSLWDDIKLGTFLIFIIFVIISTIIIIIFFTINTISYIKKQKTQNYNKEK